VKLLGMSQLKLEVSTEIFLDDFIIFGLKRRSIYLFKTNIQTQIGV